MYQYCLWVLFLGMLAHSLKRDAEQPKRQASRLQR